MNKIYNTYKASEEGFDEIDIVKDILALIEQAEQLIKQ